MARGRFITEEVREYIWSIAVKNPKWVAKQVQDKLNKELGSKGPGLSAIQKELAKKRDKQIRRGPSREDMPWSMGSLEIQDMPPEAVRLVLEIQTFDRRFGRIRRTNMEGEPLTIREAKWIARMSALTKNKVSDKDRLQLWAKLYALRERVSELMGKPLLDTFDFDIGLTMDTLTLAALPEASEMTPVGEADIGELGRQYVLKVERRLLGHSLDDIPLTVKARSLYIYWLLFIIENRKWQELTIEKRDIMVRRLRDWVREKEVVIREKNAEDVLALFEARSTIMELLTGSGTGKR